MKDDIEDKLFVYNTLSRKKELFKPLHSPHVGMYVCGPTVYGDAHLGHARPAITFDLVFRYLTHLGYKVRYVRNITDVGHLENDADEGEDKIAKKARLEQLEPMEIVQFYTNRYHKAMEMLNVLPPSIEPRASGHIIEQIAFVQQILDAGLAYESQGSVYFDVEKYNKNHHYGKLSGRNIDELIDATRELDRHSEKRRGVDFALWKKALSEHIMRWPSPWSDGFPGWHLECSAMGTKYLGDTFDIHGGGMDLVFPHHECEIAQSTAALGHESVRYWMHNNMITINGQKMGKSLGNFITLEEFFTGNHKLLSQPFSPMTVRFFILQAHYRSTLDFSNDALLGAEKGLKRLMQGYKSLKLIKADDNYAPTQLNDELITSIINDAEKAISDDLNSSLVIASLFDAVKLVNAAKEQRESLSSSQKNRLTQFFETYMVEILGLIDEEKEVGTVTDAYQKAIDLLLNLRLEAKANKDWATSDRIRNQLASFGFDVKDTKEGFEWKL